MAKVHSHYGSEDPDDDADDLEQEYKLKKRRSRSHKEQTVEEDEKLKHDKKTRDHR